MPSVPSVPAILPSTLASFGGVFPPWGSSTVPPGRVLGVRGVPSGLRIVPSGFLIDPSGWMTLPVGAGKVDLAVPLGGVSTSTWSPGASAGPPPGMYVVTVPS